MGTGKTWVVLVEDDADIAQMYRFGLEQHGFNVSVASSGEELLASLDGQAPDIFVLDYQLPGVNGADVLEMIRGNFPTSGAIVFMLSNFPEPRDGAIDRVVKFGAVAWLEKAKTTPATLARRLDQALRIHAPQRNGSAPA